MRRKLFVGLSWLLSIVAAGDVVTYPAVTGIPSGSSDFTTDYIDARDDTYSIDLTGTTDSAAGLQAAIDAAIAAGVYKVKLPCGATIRVDSPVFLYDTSGSPYQQFILEGCGMGYTESYQTITEIDCSNNLTGPCLAADVMRQLEIRDLKITGPFDVYAAGIVNTNDFYYDNAAWTPGGGIRDNAYSPQADICIDCYVGADPGSGNGYPVGTYQSGWAGGSHGVILERLYLQDGVACLMYAPTPNAQNGDAVTVRDVEIANCRDAAAFGQSQINAVGWYGGSIGSVRTAFNTVDYGLGSGDVPDVYNTQFGFGFQIIDAGNAYEKGSLNNVFVEGMMRIGGTNGTTAGRPPLRIHGGTFSFAAAEWSPPLIWDGVNPVYICCGAHFDYGYDSQFNGVYNIGSKMLDVQDAEFISDDPYRYLFIGSDKVQESNTRFASMRNVEIYDGSNTRTFLGQMSTQNGASDARVTMNNTSWPTVQSTGTSYYMEKQVIYLNYLQWMGVAGVNNIAFNDSTGTYPNDTPGTITFNCTSSGYLMVGDVVHTDFLVVGNGGSTKNVPGAYVSDITVNGASDIDVTLTKIFADRYYDETWTFTDVWAPKEFWGSTVELTASYDGDTTITNVNPTNVLRNGDFVFGPGLQDNTRVVSGEGTASITLDHAATITGDNIRMWGDAFPRDPGGGYPFTGAPNAGAGIQGIAEQFKSSMTKQGDIITTTILIDVTGLRTTASGDVIGDDGAGTDSRLMIWEDPANGTAFGGRMTALEAPATCSTDIDFWASSSANLAEGAAISGNQFTDHGVWSAGDVEYLVIMPNDNNSLYLADGAGGSDADCTAGRFLIEIWGR